MICSSRWQSSMAPVIPAFMELWGWREADLRGDLAGIEAAWVMMPGVTSSARHRCTRLGSRHAG
jgi:hypothetical protein